jgi:hypothetical protein
MLGRAGAQTSRAAAVSPEMQHCRRLQRVQHTQQIWLFYAGPNRCRMPHQLVGLREGVFRAARRDVDQGDGVADVSRDLHSMEQAGSNATRLRMQEHEADLAFTPASRVGWELGEYGTRSHLRVLQEASVAVLHPSRVQVVQGEQEVQGTLKRNTIVCAPAAAYSRPQTGAHRLPQVRHRQALRQQKDSGATGCHPGSIQALPLLKQPT